MACLPTQDHRELEFVSSLSSRDPEIGECRGPLLQLAFWPTKVFVLEHIFNSQAASDTLWEGFCGDRCVGVHFELCGAHWLDLAALVGLRAAQYRRSDWTGEAHNLLAEICHAASWDPKEIANMFAWQRQKLT